MNRLYYHEWSVKTGYLQLPVNLPTEDLGHYLPHMGPNCSIALDGGIRGTTLYQNVYTACR